VSRQFAAAVGSMKRESAAAITVAKAMVIKKSYGEEG
jgi:hypothetical protein